MLYASRMFCLGKKGKENRENIYRHSLGSYKLYLCVCVRVSVCVYVCVCVAFAVYCSGTNEPILLQFLLLNSVLSPIDCVKMW